MKGNKDSLEDILDEGIRQLQQGETLEEVLASLRNAHPEQATELHSLLKIAALAIEEGRAHRLSGAALPARAQAKSQQAFLAAARESRPRPSTKTVPQSPVLRLGFALIVLLALLLTSAVSVSAGALPGEPLYPVKLFTENTRLRLTRNPAERLELEERFDHNRVTEAQELIERQIERPVNLSGPLEAMEGQEWLVSGVRVLISSETSLGEPFEPGYVVEVSGWLRDGELIAETITPHLFSFRGKVEQVTEAGWLIEGVSVLRTEATAVTGFVAAGEQITARGILLDDGQVLALELAGSTDFPATATHPPRPTETPRPTDKSGKADETDEPRPTEKPDETGEPQPTREPEPTDKPVETDEPKPSEKPDETDEPEPTKGPKPTEKPEETDWPKPTQKPESTQKLEPTEPSEPTETP